MPSSRHLGHGQLRVPVWAALTTLTSVQKEERWRPWALLGMAVMTPVRSPGAGLTLGVQGETSLSEPTRALPPATLSLRTSHRG